MYWGYACRGYLDLDLVEEGGVGDRWCPSMVGGVVGIATGPIIQGGRVCPGSRLF